MVQGALVLATAIESSTSQISIGADTTLDNESLADHDGDKVYDVAVQETDGKDEGENADTSVHASSDVNISVEGAAIRRFLCDVVPHPFSQAVVGIPHVVDRQ